MLKLDIRLYVIMLAVILGTFVLPNNVMLQVAEAVYIEGPIAEDTLWTLVDSPFLVSNNVTVSPEATLTIEPGVEVRFGGYFSLTVFGRLYADGTDETIKFTSNRRQPDAGDWIGIEFRGLGESTLIRCSVTYATNGILVNNGKLRTQDSIIRYSSESGIKASDSELMIQDNLITDNDYSGITITGNRPVTVSGNILISNQHGILLTGNEASNIEIIQNSISTNEQNGIEINSDNHTNLDITHNNVSSNYRGFCISSLTETHITSNLISYNEIGILYKQGSHTIHFNDIYGNNLGVDVEAKAVVDAEHNFWGDESGPYHETLNPQGRGNPVGGDGFNLDFVFFLTEPFGYVNLRPTAILLTDKALVPPGDNIMFFGTNSFDEKRVDRYSFDFGDGNTTGWTTLSALTHQYQSTGVYTSSLEVMDDFGVASINDAKVAIEIADLSPLQVTMDVDKLEGYEGEEMSVTIYVANETGGMENALIKLFSLKSGNFTASSGYTNTTGYFTTTFTTPDTTYITDVRIVATASKTGYADGSDYKDVKISPSLSVQFISDSYLRTEKTTQIAIYVASDEQPVEGAAVSVSADLGVISAPAGITDSNGIFLTDFTAPHTTEFINTTLIATATKNGYLDGAGQTGIAIEPKVLEVQANAEPTVIISEASVSVSVHVEYELTPISGANVTVTLESYNVAEVTDVGGNSAFTFSAPPVNIRSNITLFVKATKEGYVDGQTQLVLTVNPGELDVQVEVKEEIGSGEKTVVTLNVVCNGKPLEGALVMISSSHGSFSDPSNTTNSKGYSKFMFTAPRTNVQLTASLIANVTKNGYIGEVGQTTTTINPETLSGTGGRWPWMTILMILIPVAVVVIIVVLIKTGLITFSVEEEE